MRLKESLLALTEIELNFKYKFEGKTSTSSILSLFTPHYPLYHHYHQHHQHLSILHLFITTWLSMIYSKLFGSNRSSL